jgi:hypothetical protein
MIDLKEDDYNLVDGGAWFSIKNFSIKINKTDDGIVVDVYQKGFEDRDPIASTWALDSEIEEQE